MARLRLLDVEDLDLVLGWRNHPDVRKNMYTTHEITPDEHRVWWTRVKGDPTKRYFIFEDGGERLGVVNFVDVDDRNRTASWAFYSGDPHRRGLGSKMEALALTYAFEDLALEKLSCEVLAFNTPVIRMHRKFGFRVEGRFRSHHITSSGRVDVYRLALTKADWLAKPSAELPIGTAATVEAVTLETLPGMVCDRLGAERVIAATLAVSHDGGRVELRVVSRIGDRAIVELEGPIHGDVELALRA